MKAPPLETEITCTRRIQFCAGHRVHGHENKCAHLHGHNYVVLLEAQHTAAREGTDGIGRVIDFSVLKEKIGGWIDEHWDHGMLLWRSDPLARLVEPDYLFADHKVFLLPYNPTAEKMAHYLLTVVGPACLHGTDVQLVRVTVWETENCFAVAKLAPPVVEFQ